MFISITSAAHIARFVDAVIEGKLGGVVIAAEGLALALDELAPRNGSWSGCSFPEIVNGFSTLFSQTRASLDDIVSTEYLAPLAALGRMFKPD